MAERETHLLVTGKMFEWLACNPKDWFSLPAIEGGYFTNDVTNVTCKNCKRTDSFRKAFYKQRLQRSPAYFNEDGTRAFGF
ncbi:hypothetical protein LCGC14_1748920 [marine sediment metagenome]|uniref:Uncharacterized protein n=1 Tax=marine sediment metagenome TaxID=412755 RepID=A0A0F9H4I1_9ZZZZ